MDGRVRPTTKFSVGQHQLRYEDTYCVLDHSEDRHWSCFAVFDGHHMDRAAKLAAAALERALSRRMPAAPAPHAQHDDSLALATYARGVRRAVTAAFLDLHLQLAQDARDRKDSSGTTATVAIVTGPLLTVANVGNSECAVDTGSQFVLMTQDDRIGQSETELIRLQEAGATVARLRFDLTGPCRDTDVGCGPLRVWPGGLLLSRSLGDRESCYVLPYPHIRQVLMLDCAARIVLATDGVWNAIPPVKACSCLRGISIQNAASVLLQKASRGRTLYDDKTVLVVDILPDPRRHSFKAQSSPTASRSRVPFGPGPLSGLSKQRLTKSLTLTSTQRSPNSSPRQQIPKLPRWLRWSCWRRAVAELDRSMHGGNAGGSSPTTGATSDSCIRLLLDVDSFETCGDSSYGQLEEHLQALDVACSQGLQLLSISSSPPLGQGTGEERRMSHANLQDHHTLTPSLMRLTF